MKKFRIKCDMSEAQIERDVSRFFGLVSALSGEDFRLTQSHEQSTGADAEFHSRGTVFMLQFKSPIGLDSTTRVPLTEKRASDDLQAIRRYRRDHDLRDDPYSLCFQLRKPSKPENPLQHNVLLKYEQPLDIRAFYVAPTILNSDEYSATLSERTPVLDFPFHYYADQSVHVIDRKAALIAQVPFLRAHISIVPHTPVTTHEHYYSYSRHANDVAFHSPEIIDGGHSRLSDFLADDFPRIAGKPGLYSLSELVWRVYESAPQDIQETLGAPVRGEGTAFRWLCDHGKLVRSRYQISQFLITAP